MGIMEKSIDSKMVEYTLDNGWMSISILNYGAVITRIIVPDKDGNPVNCVLNYQDYMKYYENILFLGAVIGPISGRISQAKFELEGKVYRLEKNEGNNHLHGGTNGYHKQFFEVSTESNEVGDKLHLRLKRHKTDGYPGAVDFLVTYSLTKENKLEIIYQAESTEKTIFNPTNHTYFNLNHDAGSVGDHNFYVNADQVQEIGDGTIPTGRMLELNDEKNSCLRLIGERLQKNIDSKHDQLTLGSGGVDLAYRFSENAKIPKAILKNDKTGIKIKLNTTEESVVVYTGNKISENGFLSEDGELSKYSGVTMETQALPDSIHNEDGTEIILNENDVYLSSTSFHFYSVNE